MIKRYFFLASLLAFTASCGGSLAAVDVPTGTIDLRQPANLKMIFDGGIRPFRLQGLESSMCYIERYNLTVILPNASPFNFEADRASFSILGNNDIYGIQLFGLYTTVPQAIDLTKSICQAWSISSNGLDQVVANLGTRPDTNKGWGKEYNPPQIRAQVIFEPMFYYDHVGGYVNVIIHCGKYPHGMKFLKGPIQPPSGYENVSMDPPPRKIHNPSVPPMSFEEAREKLKQRYEEITGQTNQPPPLPQAVPQSMPVPAPAMVVIEEKQTSSWPLALLLLAAGASLVAWFKYRRK